MRETVKPFTIVGRAISCIAHLAMAQEPADPSTAQLLAVLVFSLAITLELIVLELSDHFIASLLKMKLTLAGL